MKEQRDSSLEASLENLLISNQVRELTGYPSPVRGTDLAYSRKLLTALTRQAYAADNSRLSKKSLFKYILILVAIRILLRRYHKGTYPLSIKQEVKGLLRAAYRKVRNRDILASEVAGYIRCTDREEAFIRVCLLLRAMRRYGAAIELLLKRYNSGLPAVQTKRLLSSFLAEIGDTEASTKLSACEKKLFSTAPSSTRLNYGVVVVAMFDSEIFRTSLMSLLNSDFQGEIVVVEEGNHKEAVCESFCSKLPVKYIKNKAWSGQAKNVNLGIEQLSRDTDIVMFAHSDVLWPPNWFRQLDQAWERVYDLDKVGMINPGYMQIASTDEGLFTGTRYEDLSWTVKVMGSMPALTGYIQNVQIRDRRRLFGMAMDPWNNNFSKLSMMTGRFSVGVSFLMKIWRDIGGFDPEMSVGLEHELQDYCIKNRKWDLWVNNSPLIHWMSKDTKSGGAEKVKFFSLDRTREIFAERYGWEVDHLLSTYYGETRIIYYDEIVNAANELRFEDIDFVFDDVLKRLKTKRLSDCELSWCNSRAKCKYR